MAHELDVWLFADRVGTLALVDGRLNFCYAPSWLSHKDAVALSASLPLQAEPFDDRKTRPPFDFVKDFIIPSLQVFYRKGRCAA